MRIHFELFELYFNSSIQLVMFFQLRYNECIYIYMNWSHRRLIFMHLGQPVLDQNDEPSGRWIPSVARYFIRMANQLLVEDQNNTNTPTPTSGPAVKGYVMLTADLNVKLCVCSRNRGFEDFQRLVGEGT